MYIWIYLDLVFNDLFDHPQSDLLFLQQVMAKVVELTMVPYWLELWTPLVLFIHQA